MAKKFVDRRDEAFVGAVGRTMAIQGLTKSRLAVKTGISRTTVYNWNEQPGNVTLGNLRILTKELRLTDEEILNMVR